MDHDEKYNFRAQVAMRLNLTHDQVQMTFTKGSNEVATRIVDLRTKFQAEKIADFIRSDGLNEDEDEDKSLLEVEIFGITRVKEVVVHAPWPPPAPGHPNYNAVAAQDAAEEDACWSPFTPTRQPQIEYDHKRWTKPTGPRRAEEGSAEEKSSEPAPKPDVALQFTNTDAVRDTLDEVVPHDYDGETVVVPTAKGDGKKKKKSYFWRKTKAKRDPVTGEREGPDVGRLTTVETGPVTAATRPLNTQLGVALHDKAQLETYDDLVGDLAAAENGERGSGGDRGG